MPQATLERSKYQLERVCNQIGSSSDKDCPNKSSLRRGRAAPLGPGYRPTAPPPPNPFDLDLITPPLRDKHYHCHVPQFNDKSKISNLKKIMSAMHFERFNVGFWLLFRDQKWRYHPFFPILFCEDNNITSKQCLLNTLYSFVGSTQGMLPRIWVIYTKSLGLIQPPKVGWI